MNSVFCCQSQPKQDLQSKQIQQFINHDELKNSIYLFLRTNETADYSYLGKLKYLSHDRERERPVYFQWQIIDWDFPSDIAEVVGLEIQTISKESEEQPALGRDVLQETKPPPRNRRHGNETKRFRIRKASDRSGDENRNKELGLAGELLAVGHEKQTLIDDGRSDLVNKVIHVSQIEGGGAGYDIKSFTSDGKVKYIEVKTTEGPIDVPFQITSNEVEFSRQHAEYYYLYRVYEYRKSANSARFYSIVGSIEDSFTLLPVSFRATRSYIE